MVNLNRDQTIFSWSRGKSLQNMSWRSGFQLPVHQIDVFLKNNPLSVQLQPLFVTSSLITKQHMTLKTHVILLTFSLGKWWRRKTSLSQ